MGRGRRTFKDINSLNAVESKSNPFFHSSFFLFLSLLLWRSCLHSKWRSEKLERKKVTSTRKRTELKATEKSLSLSLSMRGWRERERAKSQEVADHPFNRWWKQSKKWSMKEGREQRREKKQERKQKILQVVQDEGGGGGIIMYTNHRCHEVQKSSLSFFLSCFSSLVSALTLWILSFSSPLWLFGIKGLL